jgi:hypothetical protein
MHPADIRIKENSWLASIAAFKLRSGRVAMVLGNTIHLHNVTSEQFLKNESWVKHELCHVQQYKKHGILLFLIKYTWESIRHGYYNNSFEVEAREAEEM